MPSDIPTRPFGPCRSPVVPIGQGTWRTEESERTRAVASLRRGLDLGLTHIDTAEMYGSGAAERIVGEAIAGRRDEVYLVSKVLPHHADRRGTITACEQSLERLRTDRLDCYLLHWPGSIPLEETLAAFEALTQAGKIRAWGVSNFDVGDLDELARLRSALPACNQVLYNLTERTIEHGVLPWCERRGVAVVAYTPFGVDPAVYRSNTPGGRALATIARDRAATPRQIALAFLLRHRSVFVIPKAAAIAHLEENAGAARLELEAEEIARLTAVFPRGEPGPLPMI